MDFYKNQEILITGKFVGITDNGRIQVRIKGINNVQFDVDPKYVSALRSPRSPAESNTKSITEPEPVEAQADLEPEYEADEVNLPGTEAQPLNEAQDDIKVAVDEEPQQIEAEGDDTEPPQSPEEKFHSKHKFKSMVCWHCVCVERFVGVIGFAME